MAEAIILRRGGKGLASGSAVLHISAPAGAAITLSFGGVTAATLTPGKGHTNAGDSAAADWFYPVISAAFGAWTVTAAKDGKSVSKTVTVDANKTYDVRLRFEYYVFKSGSGFQNGFSKLSGGMAYNELSIYSPNENSPQICISPAVDLNNYETLYVDWQHYTSSSTPRFGISTGTSNSLLTQVQRPNNTRGMSEIDVSNITGSYYIRVAGNYTTATVYNIWLL